MDNSHQARCIAGLLARYERHPVRPDSPDDLHRTLCRLRVEWLLRHPRPLRLAVPEFPAVDNETARGRLLVFFERLASEISALHPPGAVLTVGLGEGVPGRQALTRLATGLGLRRLRFLDLGSAKRGGEAWQWLLDDVLDEALHISVDATSRTRDPFLSLHPVEEAVVYGSRNLDRSDGRNAVLTRAS
ncbi:hypothetical protein EC912_102316 [Luteibacter rhizovicinus]|uniref:Uncharacterized protein n=1 Tax=Luteibacter rhizovicinus TaxID=242606 RepID=A0A4R3YVX6_9GAMM|nr:hypothetical protein [Luteibacter rhizovicinus]TCV95968.1 hypothetical protein EC912_102316 [Luteibacter rhizovicinus]